MHELATIQELVGRAGTYAGLCFSVDTADPVAGALMQEVQERGTEVETTLLFFELEWAALSDEQVEDLLADDRLGFCAHYLRNARRYREHLLSEPEEKILAEKSVTGASAWSRLFDELTSAIEVRLPVTPIDGPGEPESVALDVALSRLVLPDRELRRSTAQAVTEALAPGLRTRAFLFNTLLADKAIDDRLRQLPELAGGAQPVERGERRVGGRADRGGARALRAAPSLVSPEGAPARASSDLPTTTAWRP